ncbi:hypothetical protein HPB51_026445 [Rhipicephalus microplus]|uniref:Uncharacterized protein n=1 Tax=Rhipicephalus microplus TaxID=6941 RepID=A0A9J6D322_RHIMP|nr:hypothetical protein HPB51_026445 [Rhipicephalus microplus]
MYLRVLRREIYRLLSLFTSVRNTVKGNCSGPAEGVLVSIHESLAEKAKAAAELKLAVEAKLDKKLLGMVCTEDVCCDERDHGYQKAGAHEMVVYYLAGYVHKKITKTITCEECCALLTASPDQFDSEETQLNQRRLTELRSFKPGCLREAALIKEVEEVVHDTLETASSLFIKHCDDFKLQPYAYATTELAVEEGRPVRDPETGHTTEGHDPYTRVACDIRKQLMAMEKKEKKRPRMATASLRWGRESRRSKFRDKRRRQAAPGSRGGNARELRQSRCTRCGSGQIRCPESGRWRRLIGLGNPVACGPPSFARGTRETEWTQVAQSTQVTRGSDGTHAVAGLRLTPGDNEKVK